MEPHPLGSPSATREKAPHEAPRRHRSRWWAAAALGIGGLLLGGCQLPDFGAEHPITSQGNDAVKLWQGFFIAGAAVFLFVFALIVWAVIRYRRRSDQIPRQTQYHTALEIVYTALPIVFVLILFGFTFATENNVDALPAQNLTVTVTAFQWGWRFHYTDKDVTVIGVELQDPQMVLPENESTQIRLQSHDVIHGFYVPAFDFSRYAQPGVVNRFTLDPKALGVYRGQCTQYCGLYHSLMRFSVKVVTPSAFATWVRTHHTNGANTSISTAEKRALANAAPTSSTASTYTGSTG
ncbi:MAG: cytochrome c oxidase subunit II [Acidimicrobiales bacterium]